MLIVNRREGSVGVGSSGSFQSVCVCALLRVVGQQRLLPLCLGAQHTREACVREPSVVDLYLPMPWQGKRDWKPLEDRSCTDIPWLILFTLFCIGMVSYSQFCECLLLMDSAAVQWVPKSNPVLRRCQSFREHLGYRDGICLFK